MDDPNYFYGCVDITAIDDVMKRSLAWREHKRTGKREYLQESGRVEETRKTLQEWVNQNPRYYSFAESIVKSLPPIFDSIVMIETDLPGEFYPEVRGRRVTIIARNTHDGARLDLLQLRGSPLRNEIPEKFEIPDTPLDSSNYGKVIELAAKRYFERMDAHAIAPIQYGKS